MTNKDKTDSSSKFNFFAVLEDTISGIVEFALRFVGVTLFSLFRPRELIRRYREAEVVPAGLFPRPYTYLVICVFLFLKGLYWFSQRTSVEIETVGESSYTVKIHEFVNKLADISTVQIILSVLPTVVVILFLSMILSLLHKPFAAPGYRQTSHIFSYTFGSQIIAALAIIVLFLSATERAESDYAFGATIVISMLGALCLLVSASLSLRDWFGLSVKHKLSKLALYPGYAFLVIAISFAYFGTIVGAYSELEPGAVISADTDSIAPATDQKRLVLTVYDIEAKSGRLSVSILIQNRSDESYFLYRNASAMLVNHPEEEFQPSFPEVTFEEHPGQYLQEYLKAMEIAPSRIDLNLQGSQPVGKLILPGDHLLVTYEASITGGIAMNWALGGGIIFVPVAEFQADGTTRFTVVEATLGVTYQNLRSALAREKQKADGAIDELIKRMPGMVEQTRKDLEQILLDEENDEQPKK